MRNASVTTIRYVLLALPALLAATSLPPGLGARSGAQRSATVRGTGPALLRQQRDSRARIRVPQRADTPRAPWRFTIAEGESKVEAVELHGPCAAPHLYRVSSRAEYFRFESQARALSLGGDSPKRVAVRIDARGLKQNVYRVPVSIECLDCATDRRCRQPNRTFVAEVTVTEPSPQTPHYPPDDPPQQPPSHNPPSDNPPPQTPPQKTPPQTPPPPADDPAERRRLEFEKLSREGPQFPATFKPNDFQFRAFVKGGWPLFLDYELAQPGTITVAVLVEGFPPLVYEFRGMSVGRHEEYIKLPDILGGLGVGSYAVRAVTDAPPADEPEAFVLRSFTAGDRAVGSSGLDRVTFTPRDVQLVSDQPCTTVAYSFRALRPFSGGAEADIRLTDGGSSVRAASQSYAGLGAGETVNGSWDCRRDGRPSMGSHRLWVKAWFTSADSGSFGLANSSQVRVR